MLGPSYDDLRCQPNEKAIFDNSNDAVQIVFQLGRRSDGSKSAVNDVVPAVRHKRLTVRANPKRRITSQVCNPPSGCLPTKRNHFDRHREVTQAIHQLGLVYDNDESRARAGDDLLAQQGTASALDQVQVAPLHLICTINGQINLVMLG